MLIIELIKYRHKLQLSSRRDSFIISMTRQLYYSPQASMCFPKAFFIASPRTFSLSLCIPLRSKKYFLVQTSLDQCFVNVIQVKTCKKNSLIKYLLYVFQSRSSSPFLILLFKCFDSSNFLWISNVIPGDTESSGIATQNIPRQKSKHEDLLHKLATFLLCEKITKKINNRGKEFSRI